MKNTLFIVVPGTREQVKKDWEKGKSFPVLDSQPIFISKNNVDNYRNSFNRIIIQYSSGTMEV